jgi:hypothetical protein
MNMNDSKIAISIYSNRIFEIIMGITLDQFSIGRLMRPNSTDRSAGWQSGRLNAALGNELKAPATLIRRLIPKRFKPFSEYLINTFVLCTWHF